LNSANSSYPTWKRLIKLDIKPAGWNQRCRLKTEIDEILSVSVLANYKQQKDENFISDFHIIGTFVFGTSV